jgi:zinc transport system substrate-binding protein
MRYLILLFCFYAGTGLAAPRVVASIVPLQEISASLMTGIATPEVIIEGDASAHHFALKPSHMRRLQQADLVIWLDDHFESGFHDIDDSLPARVRRLQLIPRLSLRDDDGHVWYSSRLIAQMATLIAAALIELDPANQAIYQSNLQSLDDALSRWHRQTVAAGLPRVDRILSEHDFTAHFTAGFGLAAIPFVHDEHHDHGGLKELAELETLVRERGSNCLLTFDPIPTPLGRRLAEKYRLKIVNLRAVPVDDDEAPAIVRRLQQLLDALRACSG